MEPHSLLPNNRCVCKKAAKAHVHTHTHTDRQTNTWMEGTCKRRIQRAQGEQCWAAPRSLPSWS